MRPGTTFSPTQTRPAGHIFLIPGQERPGDDPKNRPHFLLNRCDPANEPDVLGTLAHMSTKATEMAVYRCAGHEIATSPVAKGNGREGNFVIAARLIPRPASRLTWSHLSATDEVREVRKSVRQAVGLGEGVAHEGTGSIRGRLARVLDDRADFEYGFVLTAHAYSRQRRFQIIVPVIDRILESENGPEELVLSPWDVVPKRQPWFDHVSCAEPLLETAALISFTEEWQRSRDPRRWLRKQIEITAVSIDASTLAQVESKIGERLQLSTRWTR